MRALLERSRSARAAVALLALGAVTALAHAAAAGDDLGLRRDTLWPRDWPAAEAIVVPAPPRPHHHHARRIWASSRSRPLRISLARHKPATRIAAVRHTRAPVRLARLHPLAETPVVFPRLVFLPKPPQPALVTIYQDRTLRNGDAVMMADGIHMFHGTGQWPYPARDFVRLTRVATLDWHLRRTLDTLDKNPPTRWSSMGSTEG